MNLREWMFQSNISNVKLAEMLKTTGPYICKLKHKKLVPTRRRALEIEKVTNGKVPLQEFGYCKMEEDGLD